MYSFRIPCALLLSIFFTCNALPSNERNNTAAILNQTAKKVTLSLLPELGNHTSDCIVIEEKEEESLKFLLCLKSLDDRNVTIFNTYRNEKNKYVSFIVINFLFFLIVTITITLVKKNNVYVSCIVINFLYFLIIIVIMPKEYNILCQDHEEKKMSHVLENICNLIEKNTYTPHVHYVLIVFLIFMTIDYLLFIEERKKI